MKTKPLKERHFKKSNKSKTAFNMRSVPHLNTWPESQIKRSQMFTSSSTPFHIGSLIVTGSVRRTLERHSCISRSKTHLMQMGFGDRKRLLKFRSHHSPEAMDRFRRPRKINKCQKCQSQRFDPSKIPLGCLDPPALCAPSLPARPLQHLPSLGHNTEAVSRHRAATGSFLEPRVQEEQFLKERGTKHILLGRSRGSR